MNSTMGEQDSNQEREVSSNEQFLALNGGHLTSFAEIFPDIDLEPYVVKRQLEGYETNSHANIPIEKILLAMNSASEAANLDLIDTISQELRTPYSSYQSAAYLERQVPQLEQRIADAVKRNDEDDTKMYQERLEKLKKNIAEGSKNKMLQLSIAKAREVRALLEHPEFPASLRDNIEVEKIRIIIKNILSIEPDSQARE